MKPNILYAGDTSLAGAAGYLAGVLTHAGLAFDYVASDQPIAPALAGAHRALYIISDYPVNRWRSEDFRTVLAAVRHGAGLLMIGGWESFHGAAGEYHNSPLAEALPVRMQSDDDRIQSHRPWAIRAVTSHPIIDGLPLDKPPTVGGLNRISPKPGATEILQAVPIEITTGPTGLNLSTGRAETLLVVGAFGRGRTAAFASDAAPHWVGALVDWGVPRVQARPAGGETVEVGCHYAEFFTRLVRWTMGNPA
jgi:hypothetical protein